jgi:hypothetical protein
MVSRWENEIEIDQHCKVVWIYNGSSQIIPEMNDKPRKLCNWWKKEHRRDSQYAKGKFYVVSIGKEDRV